MVVSDSKPFSPPDGNMRDLERGVSSSSSPWSILQRKRKLSLLLLITATILFVFSITVHKSEGFTSWRWVKDSMHPSSDSALSGDASAAAELSAQLAENKEGESDHYYQPTVALKSLAAKLGIKMPSSQSDPSKPTSQSLTSQEAYLAPPNKEDQVILFLSTLRNPDFRVRSAWKRSLLPSTVADLASMLQLISGKEDARLYLEERPAWVAKHRHMLPLTVFSKSYCPYSRKAKEMLRKAGAKYDVYEMDLRSDFDDLQDALREISGHRTYPTIYLKDELIGGSDSLAHLEELNVLQGMLSAAETLA